MKLLAVAESNSPRRCAATERLTLWPYATQLRSRRLRPYHQPTTEEGINTGSEIGAVAYITNELVVAKSNSPKVLRGSVCSAINC